MSRTNPYKKRRRAADKAILIYEEGLAEEMFLKYLRKLYARDSGVAVTIRNGKGGTADRVIKNAAQFVGSFDQRFVVLDNDKSSAEMHRARQKAKKERVFLIENSPCLEAFLLSILENGKSFKSYKSAQCKKVFEKRHVSPKKHLELHHYEKIFPKRLLNKQRKNIPELNRLILIIEGKGR